MFTVNFLDSELKILVLDILRKINSNEQGKVIDVDSLEIKEINLDDIWKNSYQDEYPIFLGSSHLITCSFGKLFFESCFSRKRQPCLIVFDAQGGCSDSLNAQSRNWLRSLVSSGFPSANILIVGARNLEKNERDFIREKNIKLISMNSLTEDLQDICDAIMEFSSGKELYVSIGLSVIDPIFAPAVDNPEVGGLTSREFLYLVHRIKKIKSLRAIDIVDINLEEDKKFNLITAKLCAKILSELI